MEQVDTRRAISQVLYANAHSESYLYFRNTYFCSFLFHALCCCLSLTHTLFHVPMVQTCSFTYVRIYMWNWVPYDFWRFEPNLSLCSSSTLANHISNTVRMCVCCTELNWVRTSVSVHLCMCADGMRVPFNHRQRVNKNGSLEITSLDKVIDSGNYSCLMRFAEKDQAKIVEHSMVLAVKGMCQTVSC